MSRQTRWTDQRVEDIIGNLLRAGVILSALVVFVGAIVYLARHGQEPADYRIFRGEPSDLRHISGIVRDAFAFQGRGIIQLRSEEHTSELQSPCNLVCRLLLEKKKKKKL